MSKRLPLLALLLLFVGASADAAPEHGTVIAIHTNSQNRFVDGHPGGDGVVATAGVNVTDVTQVYRIETPHKFFELQGGYKAVFALGDVVEFRIDKQTAFIRIGKKEHKFRIIGEELKPTIDKNNPLGI